MKHTHFAQKSAVFLLVLLLLLSSVNFLYMKTVYEKKMSFRNLLSYRELKADESLDFAFFGDSHTINAANPLYINNSFNFAVGAEDYGETYFKARKILHDGLKIKTAVIQLDLHS